MYYDNKLANCTNKPKTTWSVITTITKNKKNPNNISMMEIDGKITTHHQTTAEEFNNYYISVPDNITNNNPVIVIVIVILIYFAFHIHLFRHGISQRI